MASNRRRFLYYSSPAISTTRPRTSSSSSPSSCRAVLSQVRDVPYLRFAHPFLHIALRSNKPKENRRRRFRRVPPRSFFPRKNNNSTESIAAAVIMERINSNLLLQNCYILKENERLRRKAAMLNQENQALLTELKHKLSSKTKHLAHPPNAHHFLDLTTVAAAAVPDLNAPDPMAPKTPNGP